MAINAGVKGKIKESSITTPIDSQDNHTRVLGQLKEVAEVAARLRGDPNDSYVRVGELVSALGARLVNDTIQPPIPGAAVTVAVINSITGTGFGSNPLQLLGDAATPGNNMVYGTNGAGVRGWYAGGGYTPPITTKGDLFGYDTAPNRIPVGANGYVLTADNTQALGLKWAPSAGGAGAGAMGPPGMDGDPGEDGPMGPPGPQGLPAMPGASAYGEMKLVNNAVATAMTTVNLFYQITGYTLDDFNAFAFSGSALQALVGGAYLTNGSFTLASATTSNEVLLIQMFRNGVAISGHNASLKLTNTADVNSLSFTGVIDSVNAGDTFDVRISCTSGSGQSVTVTYSNVSITAIQGATGATGMPGVDGDEGPEGPHGPPGNPGTPGSTGAQGPAGPAIFLDADPAEDAAMGPPGNPGNPGATGSAGPAGPAVFLEADIQEGDMGPPGPIGIQGLTGATGPVGIGSPGADGDQGDDGMPIPGQLGPIGPAGAQGPIGPPIFLEADPGQDGDPGSPGLAGAAGATGSAGPAGPAVFLEADGPEGEMGFPGVAGVAGAAGTTGAQGQTGYVQLNDAEPGDDGQPIPGNPGAPGGTGAQGPIGPPVFLEADIGEGDQGPPGPAGPQGPQGPQGQQGTAGTGGGGGFEILYNEITFEDPPPMQYVPITFTAVCPANTNFIQLYGAAGASGIAIRGTSSGSISGVYVLGTVAGSDVTNNYGVSGQTAFCEGQRQSDGAFVFSNANTLATPVLVISNVVAGPLAVIGRDISARGIDVCRRATAIETRTSTTTLSNSTQLTFAVPGAGTYAFRAVIFVYATTATADGIAWNVNYSGTFTAAGSYLLGYTINNGVMGALTAQEIPAAATTASYSLAALSSIAVATPTTIVLEGNLIATASGTFAFAFAQVVSGVDTANLGVGSYMTVKQLS
ncbi:MAG: hypothetical protein ACHQ9S_18875 [Candidatus Binatia bacterium]